MIIAYRRLCSAVKAVNEDDVDDHRHHRDERRDDDRRVSIAAATGVATASL
jgi:hypothetical protein